MKTDHTFRKKWGQNFLADGNLLMRLLRTVKPRLEDRFLEIGPGEGAMTEKLVPLVKELATIEIDPRLVEHLKGRPELADCHILHGDVLWLELEDLPIQQPIRIIGNIPYNITSPILFWLIEQRRHWLDAFIMVQKEVAERLTGEVGTKSYGRLTVMVRAFLDVSCQFTIPPEVFVPRPRVESAVLRLKPLSESLVSDQQFESFEKLVAAAFSKRRKMLRNSLKGFQLSELAETFDMTRRPETLSIPEFVSLLPDHKIRPE